jgi:hypothetical protein
MECARCHGFMVVGRFVDLGTSGVMEFTGWRCVACGNISDPIIIANRQATRVRSLDASHATRHDPYGGLVARD